MVLYESGNWDLRGILLTNEWQGVEEGWNRHIPPFCRGTSHTVFVAERWWLLLSGTTPINVLKHWKCSIVLKCCCWHWCPWNYGSILSWSCLCSLCRLKNDVGLIETKPTIVADCWCRQCWQIAVVLRSLCSVLGTHFSIENCPACQCQHNEQIPSGRNLFCLMFFGSNNESLATDPWLWWNLNSWKTFRYCVETKTTHQVGRHFRPH